MYFSYIEVSFKLKVQMLYFMVFYLAVGYVIYFL